MSKPENYINTFIAVADDCPATIGVVPTVKEGKTKTVAASSTNC